MTLTPIERREKCNPVLIGVIASIISPLSSYPNSEKVSSLFSDELFSGVNDMILYEI